MNDNLPFVSVVIPCRNEEKFIAKCLDLLMLQDYPEQRMEIIVIDGMSIDKTREIISGYAKKNPRIRMIDNLQKITPRAINIGIERARGEIIMLPGAHSFYSPNYISVCVNKMAEFGTDVASGVSQIIPSQNSLVARAIALCLSSFFGAGNAIYKIKIVKKPVEVDTVFCGCYRKEVFDKIGFFDERMTRSQDMEFNMRLKRAGGKIMIFPGIVVKYFSKASFSDFFVHNFWDGVWAVYPLKFVKMPLKLRHYIPLIFFLGSLSLLIVAFFWKPAILALATSIIFYFAVSLCFSLEVAIREKEWHYVFLMPIAFAIRHFGYGIGSFYGIIKLLMPIHNHTTNSHW